MSTPKNVTDADLLSQLASNTRQDKMVWTRDYRPYQPPRHGVFDPDGNKHNGWQRPKGSTTREVEPAVPAHYVFKGVFGPMKVSFNLPSKDDCPDATKSYTFHLDLSGQVNKIDYKGAAARDLVKAVFGSLNRAEERIQKHNSQIMKSNMLAVLKGDNPPNTVRFPVAEPKLDDNSFGQIFPGGGFNNRVSS